MVFVDRIEELERLRTLYNLCLQELRCGVLIYGWRKVGKTTLVKRFLKDFNRSIYINCSWLPNSKSFAGEVYRFVYNLAGNRMANEFLGRISVLTDQEIIIMEALRELSRIGDNEKIPIVLDEFHIFLEKVAKKISKVKRSKAEEIKRNILWLLKDLVEQSTAFWILLSSIGWEKLQELMLLKNREEAPIIGVFEKMEVKPLSLEASIELAMEVNNNIGYDKAKTIAEISGGIPPIIITIASTYKKGSVIKHAIELTREGMFDDFFINIIKFIAELSRREYNTYMTVLKQISNGAKTISEISKAIGIEPPAIHEVLKELTKHKILQKELREYKFKFPLMKFWLQTTKELVIKEEYDSILTLLGITAESYIRELLNEAKNRKVEIWDDEKGTFLAGTVKKLELKVKEVLGKKETENILRGMKNADIIVKTEENIYLIEVKAITKPITEEIMEKLAKVVEKLREKFPKVRGILIQLGTGEITLPAVARAIENGIIIITKQGIRLIAKKLDYPIP